MICVEGNALGSQSLLLCESLRQFGGAYADCEIWAISPRPEHPVTPAVEHALQTLGVRVVTLPLNTTGSAYGSINRIVAGAWAERHMTTPYVGILDTDTLFIRPPTFVEAGAGVRPVDHKGTATAGVDDPKDVYWGEICDLGGIPLDRLPLLRTTCCKTAIRASYNGGFLIARRSLGILAHTDKIFFETYRRDLRPTPSATQIFASCGQAGPEAASWWGSSQAALSAAISAKTDDILIYDNAYNIPLHIFSETRQRLFSLRPSFPFDPGDAVLVHYHYLAAQKHRTRFLKTLKQIHCPPNVAKWISQRCSELDWPIAG
ncbi:hypothetical protein [Ancylobacter aquaticus]|nr:hypothetical protein [Ancylobacter aquaticus]